MVRFNSYYGSSIRDRDNEWIDNLKQDCESLYPKMFMTKPYNKPKIKNVIFNPPATIILWEDKTKTVFKCQGDEPYDAEKGFVMAYMKKLLGNDNTFNKEIKKWVKYEPKVEKNIDPTKPLTIKQLEQMDGKRVWVVSLDYQRKEQPNHSNTKFHTVNVEDRKLYDENDCYYCFGYMDDAFGYHAYLESPKGVK